MTSKILFKDIIKTIKLYLNFHPDTFPIILSFENHCSIPYQEVMAAELVQILGHSLYIPTEASLNGLLPSPLELRGMVVIKGRRPAIDAESGEITDDDSEDEGKSSYDYGDGTKSATAQSQQSVHHGISPALARLTLFHGTKLKSWDESVRNPTHHMHSFSESKVRSICKKKDGRKWAIYNQSHMSRSYPSGSRVDSSNYVPILAWSVGCQLVALNFQTQDASLRLNDGRFRENGGCGYVLKPLAMMEMHETLDEPAVPMRLTIRVLSGSCLPKPRDQKIGECIDPYVRVSVFDVKSGFKEVSSSFSTTVRVNNGFSPIWNEDKFSFTVENWAVAMLQLTVFDKDIGTDDFIASASIPIACLRKGLRSVKLFDGTNTTSGSFDFASLLIEVKTEKALAEI
jgi:phosphatidylinositol phospholipase C, delta